MDEVCTAFGAACFCVIRRTSRTAPHDLFGDMPALKCSGEFACKADYPGSKFDEPFFQLVRERNLLQHRIELCNCCSLRMRIENWELRIGQIRFPDYRENTEQSRQALFPRMRIENWDAERKRDSAQPQ